MQQINISKRDSIFHALKTRYRHRGFTLAELLAPFEIVLFANACIFVNVDHLPL